MQMGGTFKAGGDVQIRVIRAERAPLVWRIRNAMRRAWWRGLLGHALAHVMRHTTGITAIITQLEVTHYQLSDADRSEWLRMREHGATVNDLRAFSLQRGRRINYGVVSRQLVTDTGVGFIVDAWDNGGATLANMNFHGVGTGTNAESAGDTALQTESTTILNPDSTRATGTRSQPAANQYRSVGTLTFDGSGAITEHGLLSQAATGGGVLWDRSVFSAVNVASGDSIQATYTATLPSGG